MAGKTTLLRAIGQNIALTFSGGPVCATRFRTPLFRLRASTRAHDSLETGASYFRAELFKFSTVLAGLLRGTNSHARGIGARAVVMHLVKHGAKDLVATHDSTLCDLEASDEVSAVNVHFTDVISKGEMTFDYKLRPGKATTSNALVLLERVGVPIPPVVG